MTGRLIYLDNAATTFPKPPDVLVRMIEASTGREAHTLYVNSQDSGVSRMCADISLAQTLLNYRPQVFLREGIHYTLAQDERFVVRVTKG